MAGEEHSDPIMITLACHAGEERLMAQQAVLVPNNVGSPSFSSAFVFSTLGTLPESAKMLFFRMFFVGKITENLSEEVQADA